MQTQQNKKLVLTALFIALSLLGANIRMFGTIAFDSMPAFLASLLLGPVIGAMVGFFGHMFSAIFIGAPLGIPMHLAIAGSMALTMFCFAHSHQILRKGSGGHMALFGSGIVGLICNAPISLMISILMLYAMQGAGATAMLLPMLPALLLASAANILLASLLYPRLAVLFEERA